MRAFALLLLILVALPASVLPARAAEPVDVALVLVSDVSRSVDDAEFRMQKQGYAVRHLRDVVELAHEGEAEARRMIRDSGRYVGEVLAGAVNLLNPAVVVVAGDMAGAYEIFVAGLRETLYGNATAQATRALQVVPAAHGSRSGIVGSAMMVLDEVLSPRAVNALAGR